MTSHELGYLVGSLTMRALILWGCAHLAGKRHRSVGGWAVSGFLFGLLALGLLWLLPALPQQPANAAPNAEPALAK